MSVPWQAVGTIIAAIVGVGLWVMQTAYARGDDERRRTEQVRGMLVALLAEIGVNIERLAGAYGPRRIETHIAELREAIDAPMEQGKDAPIAPADSTNFVFDDLKQEFRLLPDAVIESVVCYYQYDLKLTKLVQFFASGAISGISDARQRRAISYYLELGEITLRRGLEAKRAIDDHLGTARTGASYASRWTAEDGELLASLDRGNNRTVHDASRQMPTSTSVSGTPEQ